MNPEDTYSAIENLLNEWQSQAEQKAIDSQKLVDDIAQVEVVAESQDRCVRVVVEFQRRARRPHPVRGHVRLRAR